MPSRGGKDVIGTRSGCRRLGMLWVGDGARQTSQGGWISADGTRGYRPPSEKDTPLATTGVQANFEQFEIQESGKRVKVGNSHLNITEQLYENSIKKHR